MQSQHGRSISLLPYPQHLALETARQYQQTPEFQQRYATRAGVEGSFSQGVRAFGLRRSRYIGKRQNAFTTHRDGRCDEPRSSDALVGGATKSSTLFSRFQALAADN